MVARRKSTAKKNTANKKRIDVITMILAAVSLILFILVIYFIRRDATPSLHPNANNTAPAIERVKSGAEKEPESNSITGIDIPPPEEPPPEKEVPSQPSGGTSEVTERIFLVKVSDEGSIGLKSVLRTVQGSGTPLTSAIKALLKGPQSGELSNDILSLIPKKSQLIGARVEGGIAFLDFSEDFRFNPLGIEGYRAQIQQIVYTATEFQTVDKVQFLVNGERVDYLGGEGFWIGTPLGRKDFQE